jgi:hypothetical protein
LNTGSPRPAPLTSSAREGVVGQLAAQLARAEALGRQHVDDVVRSAAGVDLEGGVIGVGVFAGDREVEVAAEIGVDVQGHLDAVGLRGALELVDLPVTEDRIVVVAGGDELQAEERGGGDRQAQRHAGTIRGGRSM